MYFSQILGCALSGLVLSQIGYEELLQTGLFNGPRFVTFSFYTREQCISLLEIGSQEHFFGFTTPCSPQINYDLHCIPSELSLSQGLCLKLAINIHIHIYIRVYINLQ